jgi:hypothetical protein
MIEEQKEVLLQKIDQESAKEEQVIMRKIL